MKYKTLLLVFFLFYAINGNAQIVIDSLKIQLSTAEGKGKVEILKELAIEYYLISEFPTALDYFEKGIELGEDLGDEKRLAVLFYNRAALYNDVTDYEKAVMSAQNALVLFEKVGNDLGEAAANNLLGAIFAEQDSYELALKYFQKCRLLNEEIDYEQGLAASILNIGSIHYDLENSDSALHYFQSAMEVLGDSTETEVGIDVLDNMGKIYLDRQEHEKALGYFARAVQIAEHSGDVFATLNPRLNMGLTYKNSGDIQKAKHLSLQVLADAKKLNAEANLLDAYEVLAQVYEKLGEYKKSSEYLNAYKSLNATLFEGNRRQLLVEMDAKFQVSKKEQENALLKKEKDWHQFWIRTLVGGILLLLITFTFVIIQKIQQSRLYKTLVEKNLEVVVSEKELQKASEQLKNISSIKEASLLSTKYADSGLSESQKNDVLQAIKKAMEEEKVYLQSDLTLNLLAKQLQTNRTYLSQIINQEFGKSFNTFLNEYRIREARQILSTPDLNLSIEGVAQTVGFNSVPSFNSAFKKFTGVTPSFYMKSTLRKP